jgi:hypothetical protein
MYKKILHDRDSNGVNFDGLFLIDMCEKYGGKVKKKDIKERKVTKVVAISDYSADGMMHWGK